MLEIFGIMWFARTLGALAEGKGRRPGGYKFLGVVSWVGGELLGAIIGASIGNQAAIYGYMIMSAIVCNFITYSVVSGLAPLTTVAEESVAHEGIELSPVV